MFHAKVIIHYQILSFFANYLIVRINEETFWRNYFYRVSLIRQANELSSMAQEGGRESDPTSRANSTDVEPAGKRARARIYVVVSVHYLVRMIAVTRSRHL
jgi:hypothetical protein